MDRLLIISDIHLRHNFVEEQIIKNAPYDRILFLGDYFDNWNDTPIQNQEAAEWLKESLNCPDRIHLFGNHEMGYCFGEQYSCSGFNEGKKYLVNKILGREDWNKLKFWHIEGNCLFTHAGYKYHLYKGLCSKHSISSNLETCNINKVEESLIDEKRNLDVDLLQNYPFSKLIQCGFSRGGFSNDGGLTWCDLNEFYPIPNINQIFGHSIIKSPQFIYTTKGNFASLKRDFIDENYKFPNENFRTSNFCLDTNNRNYAILEGAKLEIYQSNNHRLLLSCDF